MKDDVKGSHVAVGCLSVIAMIVIINLDIFALWKFLLIGLLFLVGAFTTKAFD